MRSRIRTWVGNTRRWIQSFVRALPWLLPRALFVPAFYVVANCGGSWIQWTGGIFFIALVPYWMVRQSLINWLSKSSRFKIPKPPGKRSWTIYLLNLVLPGYLLLNLIWGDFWQHRPLAKAFDVVVTFSLFTVATFIMARQAYLLRNEDLDTYRKGLRTARAVTAVIPVFAVVAFFVGSAIGSTDGPLFDSLRGQLYSAIGISAVLAAYVGSVPERISAQREARSRRVERLRTAMLARRKSHHREQILVKEYHSLREEVRSLRLQIDSLGESTEKPWHARLLLAVTGSR